MITLQKLTQASETCSHHLMEFGTCCFSWGKPKLVHCLLHSHDSLEPHVGVGTARSQYSLALHSTIGRILCAPKCYHDFPFTVPNPKCLLAANPSRNHHSLQVVSTQMKKHSHLLGPFHVSSSLPLSILQCLASLKLLAKDS